MDDDARDLALTLATIAGLAVALLDRFVMPLPAHWADAGLVLAFLAGGVPAGISALRELFGEGKLDIDLLMVLAALAAVPVDGADISRLRAVRTGAAPLPPELAQRFAQTLGLQINESLGMTETAGLSTVAPPGLPAPAGCVARCFPAFLRTRFGPPPPSRAVRSPPSRSRYVAHAPGATRSCRPHAPRATPWRPGR